ncbi:helix-turn-helix transcriptional regulator [Streptococcus ratti]|uniref:HTH cro/C1-type domain-containing protein n=1 Tax=Streptococcus ratti FA-1 = DSM 20564 TaxID=699248 RepID=A0ABP2QYL8_STRRT|nr:helix-turn-helix transcriptional regulator [Streptococcus ratti]EJN94096.1 hypothetical protein SRA_06151 [Streptococcus ratti FA-1 = DSM 20564]EMP70563.1 putative transcriptional regulator [Streptococcus ratti FA-1 = DSM 20564]QEY07924.1 helix-turn-helix transcriptional regulator [Streptococcus ratti]VEI60396.1 putative transcriptional regulator [Streptococcus mutans]
MKGDVTVEKLTLRALRVNYSLSPKEVADCLGIEQQTLLKYEEDSSDIPIHLANALADYYGINLDSVFLGPESDLKQKFKESKLKNIT